MVTVLIWFGLGAATGLLILLLIFVGVAAFTDPPNMEIVACKKCGDLCYGYRLEDGVCDRCEL